MRSESFRKGLKDGVPIGLGYFAVSFTFGMMAVADGLSIWPGSPDLSDKCDISRTVCRSGDHGDEWFLLGNGSDSAYY